MHGDPSTRKYCYKTTPHNAPNGSTVRKVGTTISCQRAVVDGRDGAGVDICAPYQVVDENEKQHCDEEVQKGTLYCDTSLERVLNIRIAMRPKYHRALQGPSASSPSFTVITGGLPTMIMPISSQHPLILDYLIT